MSDDNSDTLLDSYLAWEAQLDPITEEPFPSWVHVICHVAFRR